MTELIDYIDSQIKSCLGIEEKFQGLAEQKESQSETYPYVIENKKERRIAPNDLYDVQIYHRLLNGNSNVDEAESWGRKKARRHENIVRMVVILKTALGESYIDDIITALPDKIVISGYHVAECGEEVNKIVDHAAISEQEFGEAWTDKINIHKFNLYAIEYQLEYIQCNVCT